MLHSLSEYNYLKIEQTNFLYFAFSDYDNRTISVMEQYSKEEGGFLQTRLEDIYRVKVHEATLRELLLLQSIYAVRNPSDISKLIKE